MYTGRLQKKGAIVENEFEELNEKLHSGLRLLGNMVRHPLWDRGVTARCTTLHSNGDVEVDGCDRIFDPDELEVDGERVAVPLLGKVR